MKIVVAQRYEDLCQAAAAEFQMVLRARPDAVLGLATGSTPLGLYAELIRLGRTGQLDFSRASTFNLDEYVGLTPDHPQSYHHFMQEHLFRQTNFCAERTHIPSGVEVDVALACARYEELIRSSGGIDLQILGIGSNGHIGFNEPGSAFDSRTRQVTLSAETIAANARFFARAAEVPRSAVTMGIGTILEARRILLLATGPAKAAAVRDAIVGPATPQVPASALQTHPDVTFYLDAAAAHLLDRQMWEGTPGTTTAVC